MRACPASGYVRRGPCCGSGGDAARPGFRPGESRERGCSAVRAHTPAPVSRLRRRGQGPAHAQRRRELPAPPWAGRRRHRGPADEARARPLRPPAARQPRHEGGQPGLGCRRPPVPASAQGLRARHRRRHLRRPDPGGGRARPERRRHLRRRPRRQRHDRCVARARLVDAERAGPLPAPGTGAGRRSLRCAPRGRTPASGHRLPGGLRHPDRRRRRRHDDLRGAQLRRLRQPGGGPASARLHHLVRAHVVDHDLGGRVGERRHATRLRRLHRLLDRPAPALRGAPLQHAGRPGAAPARRGGEQPRRRRAGRADERVRRERPQRRRGRAGGLLLDRA